MSPLIAPSPDTSVGIVGSDSSTGTLSVDIMHDAKRRPLNGRMVLIAPTTHDETTEYALGTITGITTRNRFHEDPALRGVMSLRGNLGDLTSRGDIKTATVDVQAAFREGTNDVVPLGGSLSFAPDTGESVYPVTADVVATLAKAVTDDLFYTGSLYRQPEIPLPMHVPDFSGARGSSFAAFLGPSGAGKTNQATLYVGSQLRLRNMSFLVIDPQRQFTTTHKVAKELPIDLRALAEAQGRTVRQLSIVTDIQMSTNPSMLLRLLDNEGFIAATSGFGASVKTHEVRAVLADYLSEERKDWATSDAGDLLADLCQHLIDNSRSIMSTDTARERFEDRLRTALTSRSDSTGPWRRMMGTFEGYHAMFSPTRPDGSAKVSIDTLVKDLCASPQGATRWAPAYFLALGAPTGSDAEHATASKAMRSTSNQMIVLRSLFDALEKESRRLYQRDDADPANLMVVLDEAARYTSDSARASSEARQMADDMARYFREIRKYAVGFCLILQEPSVLHESIWKQLRNGFRAIAGGLVGNDLEKVREQLPHAAAMNLYQQLAQPSATNPVYPWMLCGSITPINTTNNPVFMEAFTPRKWADANRHWLPGTFNVDDTWSGAWG